MEKLRITVNGRSYDVVVEVLGAAEASSSGKAAPSPGQPLTAINGGKSSPAPVKSSPEAGPALQPLLAPMPGTVLDIRVKPGETVQTGQVLLTLEAMKMENELTAESSGQVKEIHVSRGQSVQAGEALISFA